MTLSPTTRKHPIHLCIGSPRAGTTWLFREMRQHHGIFLPLIKEVRYWNSRRSDQQTAAAIKQARIDLEGAWDRESQEKWLSDWGRIPRDRSPDIDEYIELMSAPGRPSLDISPTLGILPRKTVKLLREQLPEGSKAIFMLREPLSRLASQVKLHFHLHGHYRGSAASEDLERFLNHGAQRNRWDYTTIIDTWRGVFRDDFKIIHYQGIVDDPRATIKEIADFLDFEMSEDTDERSEESFFHSNQNQNKQSGLPKMGPRENQVLARMLEPEFERFAEAYPEMGSLWLDQLRQKINVTQTWKTPVADVDMPVMRLMRMTESLGDNCEYGFWQRHRGYEPSSLFRWAITPVDALNCYLENRKEVFSFENLKAHSPAMVEDTKTGFYFHCNLVERNDAGKLQLLADPDKLAEAYRPAKEKFDFLANKFWRQIRRNPAVYVVKRNEALPEETVFRLLKNLHALNPAHCLLWVDAGKPTPVTEIAPGLYHATITRFANYHTADDYDAEGWTRVMTELVRMTKIEAMIARMAV